MAFAHDRPGRVFALAGLVLLAAGAPASAKGPGGGGGRGQGPPPIERVLERHAERLALDTETRARIEAAARESRTEREALQRRLRGLHEAMRTLMEEESPDVDRVMAQAERIGEAETALRKQRLRTTLRIRGMLTPEQRAELVRIHQERRQQRRQGSGGGPRTGRRRGGPPGLGPGGVGLPGTGTPGDLPEPD